MHARHKSLDVVLGSEETIVIVDDSPAVWPAHASQLLIPRRYHYFASSASRDREYVSSANAAASAAAAAAAASAAPAASDGAAPAAPPAPPGPPALGHFASGADEPDDEVGALTPMLRALRAIHRDFFGNARRVGRVAHRPAPPPPPHTALRVSVSGQGRASLCPPERPFLVTPRQGRSSCGRGRAASAARCRASRAAFPHCRHAGRPPPQYERRHVGESVASVRRKVLAGCAVVFSHVIPLELARRGQAHSHSAHRLAVSLGARGAVRRVCGRPWPEESVWPSMASGEWPSMASEDGPSVAAPCHIWPTIGPHRARTRPQEQDCRGLWGHSCDFSLARLATQARRSPTSRGAA